jgi:retron-type reverse transcriptase
MITYKEFSSLVSDLGFSGKTLYSVSNGVYRHYRAVEIPKGNGETRKLYVPDDLLKSIQRAILDKLLSLEEISPYATAYRPGGSTKRNALPHVQKPVILKLDIRHFFDHLIYPLVKQKAFPAERYSEQNRVLLSLLCIYKEALPQGAPTSPTISNIIMREFDNAVGAWCTERGIAYTRYCDDMTFSGDFDPSPVIRKVRDELRRMGLFLNDRKTVVVRKGQKHSVTGIVVNEKMSVSRDYKKHLSQEMYYCMKYGVAAHLSCLRSEETEAHYLRRLLGRVNYVLSLEPENRQMKQYRAWLTEKKS